MRKLQWASQGQLQDQKSITRHADLAAAKMVATSDYTFDAAGRLTSLSHAQGAVPLAGYAWTYDAANRVTEFTSLLDCTSERKWEQTNWLDQYKLTSPRPPHQHNSPR